MTGHTLTATLVNAHLILALLFIHPRPPALFSAAVQENEGKEWTALALEADQDPRMQVLRATLPPRRL